MKKRTRAIAALAAIAALTLVGCSQTPQGDGGTDAFTPDGPVELVVPFSSGGGVDLAGRTVAELLTSEGIVDADIRVENREGGSGLVGMSYIEGQKSRGDRLMVLGAHIVSTPLLQSTTITHDGFTPLATLYADYVYFFVRPDSKIQTVEDLGKALQADPGEIRLGGSVPGGPGHLATANLAEGFGVDPTKLTYVPYDGDEAITALLGGHVDVASSGPEGLDMVEAGQLKAIAVSSAEPLEGRSAGIPTFAEGGSDSSYVNFRIILGPPDMAEPAVKYWKDALTKLEQSTKWTDAMEKYGWSPFFQTEGLEEFLNDEHEKYQELLTKLGVIDG